MSMNHIFAHRLAMVNLSAASSTSASDDSSLTAIATQRGVYQRSNIGIELDNHYNSKVYNSSSPISGQVTITTKRDVRFDMIQILLLGSTQTRVDGLNNPHQVTHTFLKIPMPIPESTYPVPRILESGRTYSIPFNFVIPSYLTINACNHHILSPDVQGQHVRMPPTLGGWEKDDMAPEMAQVEYAIVVRVYREPELGGPKVKVMDASRPIRVLPASGEEPPLTLTKSDRLYKLSKSKKLRKSILAGKLGKVTATAMEPPAVVLRPDGRGATETSAHVQLTFEPASTDVAPPKISGVSGKVTARTFFSSGTISSLPNLSDWSKQVGGERRGSYSSSVTLRCAQAEATAWSQEVGSGLRRDSGYGSTAEVASDSDSISLSDHERRASQPLNARSSRHRPSSPVHYSSTVSLPVALPVDKKTYVPTFHSCIASRVYVLHLSISVGSGSASTTMSLAVPLQVVVDSSNVQEDLGELPSFETALGEAEADEFLRPRVLQVPDQQFMQTSLLPGYGDVRQGR